MGRVYRALDGRTGSIVAVKVIRSAEPASEAAARFDGEIRVLSELAHPGIVAYVAHGHTDEGDPFLVMEHLEGEDLGARLARERLGVHDSLRIMKGVATALHEAHRRGIVHRDLKPSNLFLRDRQLDRVAILDFGIARRSGVTRSLTRTGGIVGTPEYMAPEQVRGARDVGPAADVFALGSVLYECLAGRPPFPPDHPIAMLARILTEQPPSIERFCPDIPVSVRDLLARMLEKDPAKRLRDAGELLEAISVSSADTAPQRSPTLTRAGLGSAEMQLVSVIIATSRRTTSDAATLDAGDLLDVDPAAAVQRELKARGVAAERIGDGSLVVTLTQRGDSAVDQAVEAAGCARIVRARWPDAQIAVATARGIAGARLPVGEALERAALLLGRGEAGEPHTTSILLDSVTAGLLDGRVRTSLRAGGVMALDDDASILDETRPLLGKPTPCVGREQELAALTATVSASFDEGSARAALVVGPPGLGKSRVRHELLRRLEQREDAPALRIEGRGEAARAGSPYGVLGVSLRRCFQVAPGDDLVDACAKLIAGVSRFVPAAEARAIAEILGELCDVPFPDAESVKLRAGRQDPRMMQAQIGDAFVALLRAATENGGALLVLEDLHWGDRRSLDLVETALRELADRPLCVIAFARPEIHDTFPGLWKGRAVEIPLVPLGRRACERLVERVAGGQLAPAVVARIVEQSAGNALFLEELLRAACAGDAEGAPATVLAMLQARIGRFDAGERRVLRAASILGESFDTGGVVTILGQTEDADEVARRLATLTELEVIEPQRDAPGGHRFRHGLMREAAYGLLTEDDRRLGHHLAAAWLAEREHDPALIAEHHLAASEPDAAVPWLVKAAQRAHERDDFAATDRLAERARAAGARGEALGAALALGAFAAIMRWDWSLADARVTEAREALRPGTSYWAHALRVVMQLAAYRNDLGALRRAIDGFLRSMPEPDAEIPFSDTALHAASACTQVGLLAEGRLLLRRAEQILEPVLPRYPLIEGWLNLIRCTYLRHTDDDLGAQIELLRAAARIYESFGAAVSARVLVGDTLGEVLCRAGALDEGAAMIRGALAQAVRLEGDFLVSHARLALANALCARGGPDAAAEAEALARELLATRGISSGYQAMSRDVIAQVHLARGDFTAAEREVREAIALSPHTPVRRWLMSAHLAGALSGAGRHAEALAAAMGSVREMDEAGGGGYAEVALLAAAARAAELCGEAVVARDLALRRERWIERQRTSLPKEMRAAYAPHVTR